MNLKNNILIFDTETMGLPPHNIIYDIGWTIVDRQGNEITSSTSYVVRETMTNFHLMKKAYYHEKVYTHYIPALTEGSIELADWLDILKMLNRCIEEFSVGTVAAYNIKFDMSAMKLTHHKLGHEGKTLNRKAKFLDLWLYACQTIFATKKYNKWANEHGRVSKAGNVQTSAEAAFAYLTDDPDFVESHTAAEDSDIEAEIFRRIQRRKVKMPYNQIVRSPWKLAQIGI